jgi:hypothetical protein
VTTTNDNQTVSVGHLSDTSRAGQKPLSWFQGKWLILLFNKTTEQPLSLDIKAENTIETGLYSR